MRERKAFNLFNQLNNIFILEIFNPILQKIIVNNTDLSALLDWTFDAKGVEFKKFAIIQRFNGSQEKSYFIPKGCSFSFRNNIREFNCLNLILKKASFH